MNEILNIADLKANQKDISLAEVEVLEVSPIKEFSKFGKPGRVCNAIIKDSTGEISLTLWNDEIDLVSKGTKLSVENAFVKEWQGYKQINTGRTGVIKVLK